MANRDSNKKIVNIDNSRNRSAGNSNSSNRKANSKLKTEFLVAFIFLVIFVYIIINVFFYYTKEKVSIYEVQGDDISVDTRYKGIAIREEYLVSTDYAGYINYYVQNGKRTTNNGVVFSVDESSYLYSQINENTGVEKLTTDEIKQIKNLIYGYKGNYSQANFGEITQFKEEITDTIYEIVNDASIESMYSLKDSGSTSSFHVRKSSYAGIVSYKTDDLCGCVFDDLSPEMFADDYTVAERNMKSTGLISSGSDVYRIIPDENWQIAVNIPEKLYLALLEKDTVEFYINDYFQPLTGSLQTIQKENNYYALISLDQYMSMFVDDRILEIEFNEDTDGGLKVPLSAISKKNFYLIPLSMFVESEEYNGNVLFREAYDPQSGETVYEPIHASKYFSDGHYAYVDTNLLNEGDLLVNTETEERLRVNLVNSLEGVYNVNKGYYRFVRIERIKQNNEYAIVKKDTDNGLRLYDHIALHAEDAIDQAIIY